MQWVDEEGKTPLIVACTSSDLFIVAKTLIDLGANVNSYRAGMCNLLRFPNVKLFNVCFMFFFLFDRWVITYLDFGGCSS